MSDGNLLVFGCIVTFIGVVAAYVYIREAFAAGAEQPSELDARVEDAVKDVLSDVA